MIQPKRFSMKVIVGTKSAAKTVCTTFTPPTDPREIINELQAIIVEGKSASDAQKLLAPPKRNKKLTSKIFDFFSKISECFQTFFGK